MACVSHASAVPFGSSYSLLNITSLVACPVVVQCHPWPYSPEHMYIYMYVYTCRE